MAILISGVGWGTEGVATRAAFQEGIGPYSVAMLRAVIAAVASYAYLAVTRQLHRPDRLLWRQGIFQGVMHLAVPWVLLTLAYERASAGFVALLVTLIPLTTAVMAHFTLRERLGPGLLAGFVVAALGVAVLVLSGDSGLAVGGAPVVASVLTLVAVLAIVASTIYAKRDAGAYDPTQLTALQMAIGAVLIAVILPFVGGVSLDITARGWAVMLFLAIGATVIPYLCFGLTCSDSP